ncbi:MAG: GcvT family protein, partial [Alphaproteobacteria bacterium]
EALVLEHKRHAGQARDVGLPLELIGPNEVKTLFPLASTEGVLGAAYTPEDGHVDPASLTDALAGVACESGAEIRRRTRVTGLKAIGPRDWRVSTEHGEIAAEVVINAAGLWAREVAAMVGYRPPMVPMERQYLVTEPAADLRALKRELPVLRDIAAPLYLRQEGQGLLLGLFDREPVFWAEDSTPDGFERELLPPDLERVSGAFERAMRRVPALRTLGVKTVVNGPLMRTPDANPLLGPVPGLDGFYMNAGYFAGFAQCGSACRYVAEWIVAGEPSIDLGALDVRRFGAYATIEYTRATTRAAYAHEFGVGYPHDDLAAGAPARTSPIHRRLEARGATFSARNGWEAPAWFAPKGVPARDEPSFGRANWFPYVARECHAVMDGVAVLDLSSLVKVEVTGPDSGVWLDRLCANRLPARPGEIASSPILNTRGGVAALVSLARLGEDRFYVTAAAAAEQCLLDILERHLPRGSRVAVANRTADRGALLVAGPRSRELLERVTDDEVASAAFPWLVARELPFGPGRTLALCLSSVGELAWELHHDAALHAALYDRLHAAGDGLGLVDFGMRAFDSLRLEKGYPRWGIDLGPATDPFAAGLGHLIAPKTGGFVGREALEARRAQPPGSAREVLVTLVLEDGGPDNEVVPWGAEPVLDGDEVVGLTSSGGYGHRIEKRIALAYVRDELARAGLALEVEILGHRSRATVALRPPYDPEGARLRP